VLVSLIALAFRRFAMTFPRRQGSLRRVDLGGVAFAIIGESQAVTSAAAGSS
jgi:hypothetical protein